MFQILDFLLNSAKYNSSNWKLLVASFMIFFLLWNLSIVDTAGLEKPAP